MNTGKEVSPEAIAAGEDDDDDDDSKRRDKALLHVSENLDRNQNQQADWTKRCKEKLAGMEAAYSGGAPPAQEISAAMQELRHLYEEAEQILTILEEIAEEHNKLRAARNHWKLPDL